jgi:hypothetical protein
LAGKHEGKTPVAILRRDREDNIGLQISEKQHRSVWKAFMWLRIMTRTRSYEKDTEL